MIFQGERRFEKDRRAVEVWRFFISQQPDQFGIVTENPMTLLASNTAMIS